MKVSVSLPEEDVAFLDAYARARGIPSRSAALRRAIRMLRTSELAGHYAEAWEEWADRGDGEGWEVTVADGLAG